MVYKPDVIVYHYPCTDGGTSAYLLSNFYDDKNIDFVRGQYGDKNILDTIVALAEGRKLMFVDFSLPPDDMRHLATKCQSILVIDHHDTAVRNFKSMDDVTILEPTPENGFSVKNDFSNFTVFMTMENSGAGLTYRFLHGFDNIPEMIRLIERIDLGKDVTEPDASDAERMGALKYWSRSFEPSVEGMHQQDIYEYLMADTIPQDVLQSGESIRKFVDYHVSQAAQAAQIIEFDGETEDDSFAVPVAFGPYAYASDLANYLIYTYAEGKYNLGVAIYFNDTGMGLSMRSKNGVEANAVAEALGGGGHKQAAGVNVSWENVENFIKDVLDR